MIQLKLGAITDCCGVLVVVVVVGIVVVAIPAPSAYLRRKGSGFLCVAVERWPRDALRTTLPPIMGQMRKALFDADATVRREGRHTFGVFIRLW